MGRRSCKAVVDRLRVPTLDMRVKSSPPCASPRRSETCLGWLKAPWHARMSGCSHCFMMVFSLTVFFTWLVEIRCPLCSALSAYAVLVGLWIAMRTEPNEPSPSSLPTSSSDHLILGSLMACSSWSW